MNKYNSTVFPTQQRTKLKVIKLYDYQKVSPQKGKKKRSINGHSGGMSDWPQ